MKKSLSICINELNKAIDIIKDVAINANKPIGCFLGNGQRSDEIILAEGEKSFFHINHRFKTQQWDCSKFGKQTIDIGEYYATYQELYKCKCGKEIIVQNRAFI